MSFVDAQFVTFCVVFFPLYFTLRGRARIILLVIASYVFYASWDPRFVSLLAVSTVVDFAVGLALARTQDERKRKLLLVASVVANLGILAYFKYANFFIDSALLLSEKWGVPFPPAALEIALPVGLSFYSFQTLSYSIDVYRRALQPCRSLVDFAAYVAFFPQLVAGPIERASTLLPQLHALASKVTVDTTGFALVALGLFKKAVFADHFADLVEVTYHQPSLTPAPALWIGTYAFAIQIYCDFSAYSDIAVGLGRLMGVELMTNFQAPYAAVGPTDFWRRWHISLSTWLRDYLYISLGGNRGGRWRTYRNLAVTMLLGGLWHGAAWNFVVWGAFHGLLLIVARVFPWERTVGSSLGAGRLRLIRVARGLAFFQVVCLGWALFRATSLADCLVIWRKLLNPFEWHIGAWLERVRVSGEGAYLATMMGIAFVLVFTQNLWPRSSKDLVAVLWKAPLPVRIACVATMAYIAIVSLKGDAPEFIYFRF
jgi:D-alanyl-lipoteichoic acid acyltransferase DltB (MBOAT superfamily)